MRTGLVVLGTIIAVLGVGLILTLVFLSSGSANTSQVSSQDPDLAPHSNETWIVSGPTPGAGSIALSWTASSPANVSLWPVTSCVGPFGPCRTGSAVLRWSAATSGQGTVVPSNASLYILLAANPGNLSLRFSAMFSISFAPTAPFPAWGWGLIATGGVALLTIGGIALFLGLFLPAGVYPDPDVEVAAVRHPSLPPEDWDSDRGERRR
ncbi:MAG: hypothetical protein ACLPWO_07255 [Thermoplasmata archaeon]